MSVFFCDTSGLVKRYVIETGSAWLTSQIAPTIGSRIYIAQITIVEVVSAITRKERGNHLSAIDAANALNTFENNCSFEFSIVPLSTSLVMKSAKFFIIFTFLLAFAVSVSAQNLYPNELKEYKLFRNEKLKTLKIGISTRADVNKLFDSDCQYECDFNQNWTIKFKFFSEESESPLSYLADINLKPKSKYIGKLFSIIFMPKSVISFENIKLPKVFNHIGGIGVTTKNSSGSTDISSQKYRDNYGLQYEVQYETPLTDSGKEILKERKARLESIEYGASNALVRKMFIRAK